MCPPSRLFEMWASDLCRLRAHVEQVLADVPVTNAAAVEMSAWNPKPGSERKRRL